MKEKSREYAEAFYSLAAEEGRETEYLDILTELCRTFDENPGYREMLDSPGLTRNERTGLIDAAFCSLPEYFVSFIKMLSERRYMHSFDRIAEEYREIYREANRMITAKVISAVALTEDEKAKICKKLENKVESRVLPVYTVDPSIIGGVIVEINGSVIDGSLKHRLREVKEVISR